MSRFGEARFDWADLIPLLRAQPGVCRVCHQWSGEASVCAACRVGTHALRLSAVSVLPISLALKHGRLATTLWQYKDSEFRETREAAAGRLSHLLDVFMAEHESCLGGRLGVDGFEVLTWVPSSNDRAGEHPLQVLLEGVAWSSSRLREGLRIGDRSVPAHAAARDKFVANPALTGKSVLVVDDTWTRGANALSAVAALRARGAVRVAVAVIGRHFVAGYRDCAIFADATTQMPFEPGCCVFCDQREVLVPPLPERRSLPQYAGLEPA
jgi:hypothetical protein